MTVNYDDCAEHTLINLSQCIPFYDSKKILLSIFDYQLWKYFWVIINDRVFRNIEYYPYDLSNLSPIYVQCNVSVYVKSLCIFNTVHSI